MASAHLRYSTPVITIFWLASLALANQAHSGSFLSSGSTRGALQHRRDSKDHLRSAAARLAAALRAAVASKPTPLRVPSARKRLADEANRLQLGDPSGALLLRSYADFAPAPMLFLPLSDADDFGPLFAPTELDDGFDDDSQAAGLEDAGLEDQSSTESEETVYTSKNGRTISLRKRCRDGDCVQQKVVSASPTSHHKMGVRMQPRRSHLGSTAAQSSSLSNAARQMVDSMRAAEKVFGNDEFQNILKNGFSFPAEDDFDNVLHLPRGANATDGQAVSSETVTKVDGTGNMVTQSKRCSNGRCTTEVVEKKLGSANGGEGESPLTANGNGAADSSSTSSSSSSSSSKHSSNDNHMTPI